jgi:hypothetical protein
MFGKVIFPFLNLFCYPFDINHELVSVIQNI